jgi:hypothetical protein
MHIDLANQFAITSSFPDIIIAAVKMDYPKFTEYEGKKWHLKIIIVIEPY